MISSEPFMKQRRISKDEPGGKKDDAKDGNNAT